MVTLRNYRPGDWKAMYALDVVCFEPAFRFSRGAMRSFAETPGAIDVLAESEGELVGFCIVQMEQQFGYIVTLDVAPASRWRGLAARLMVETETRVRSAVGLGINLHVSTENSGAMQFYEARGYAQVELAKGFYGPGLDALLYGKKF